MSGDMWGFLWIMLVLKIPLAMLLYIVWYAIKAVPEVVDESDDDGGQRRPRGPRITPPRPPRRGPHGDPTPSSPDRMRTTRPRPHVPDGHR
jgi:hypothetical protein